jgi:hypothetical protein
MERGESRIPLQRPRFELTLLALVAVVTLTPLYAMNAQDVSRLCLTRSLAQGRLSADGCLEGQLDKSIYGGHLYSDKAPGMSALELPVVELVGLEPIRTMNSPTARLWLVRILSSGVAFLVCALLVGRLAEGLARGTGGAALVTFALGSSISGLAASNFGHVTAGLLAFTAFLLVWGNRPGLGGLAAGAAPLVEYQTAAIGAILALYVLRRNGSSLGRYAAGTVPGIALLLAYDQLAFGAPWHLSYRYLDNGYAAEQAGSLFGINSPTLFSSYEVLSGPKGLLVVTPVLVASAWGLVLFARRHKAEAITCGAVVLFFVLLNCAYFLPYGGVSPGPRFLVPALPFLAAGLGPAFAWRPRITALLAGISVVGSTSVMLVWASDVPLRGSIWGEIARVPIQGTSSRFVRSLTPSALDWVGVGRQGAALVIALTAGAALVLGLRGVVRPRAPVSRRAAVAVAASMALVVVATASAVTEYPYGGRAITVPSVVTTRLSPSTTTTLPGGEVDFTVSVTNPTGSIVSGVVLTVGLPEGFTLLGAPYYERGHGCVGSRTITCNLDFLLAKMSTEVRFGTRVGPSAASTSTVTAATAAGGARGRPTSVAILTGAG